MAKRERKEEFEVPSANVKGVVKTLFPMRVAPILMVR